MMNNDSPRFVYAYIKISFSPESVMSKVYYEQPGNRLNPHSYFYRVTAVPLLKVLAVTWGTFYALDTLWGHLHKEKFPKEVTAKQVSGVTN